LRSVRALGETDLNPVSGIGKISQLLFAVLQPGRVVANIIAGTQASSDAVSHDEGLADETYHDNSSGGVAEAGAQQAGDLMQDLKTGALLRASPRSQFYGQMIGSLASVFVSTAAYKLYKSVYEIPGPAFRVPTAAIWCVERSLPLQRLDGSLTELPFLSLRLNLARLLNTGHLPDKAPTFMVLFGFLFALSSFTKSMGPLLLRDSPRWFKHIPSGIAL
jgi:hypothetical protein